MSILTITGPTASGKTALALALSKLAPIEIVSADSRQVYRGLDIGTAKPTRAELQAVRHHGIDLIEPAERYSAGRFARDASGWIADIRRRGRMPVVVGGTGFYLKALFEGLFEEPELGGDALRERVRAELGRLPAGEVTRWARRLDPGFTGEGGRQRATRAVEVALLAGRPLSALQQDAPAVAAHRPFYARIELSREALTARIRARTAAMLDAGLVAEVQAALAGGVPATAPGLSGVGYREVIEALASRSPREALETAIVVGTRRYAKRQQTWLRHQLREPVMALDGTRDADALAREVLSGYRAATPDGA